MKTMKNKRFWIALLVSLIVLSLIITFVVIRLRDKDKPFTIGQVVELPPTSTTYDDGDFSILFPRYNLVIAPERDFYIIGSFNTTFLDTARLDVTLMRDIGGGLGLVVRQVHANMKSDLSAVYTNYDLMTVSGSDDENDIRRSLMPDLIFDGTNADSFRNQWLKCAYDDNNFTAVFNGGRYDSDFNPLDQTGVPYEPLIAGNYAYAITVYGINGNILSQEWFFITIDVVQEKVLSRFSPSDHLDNVLEIANTNGYDVYIDPFPGNWPTSDIGIVASPNDNFEIRINRRWRFADGMEYEDGRVHFFIYNIEQTSTTYTVEIPVIMLTGSINNSNRLVCYYYDVGDISVGGIVGQLIPFEHTDRLQIMRADYSDDTSVENFVIFEELEDVVSDFIVDDGINTAPGETISLFGVVKPIQLGADEIIRNDRESTFELLNRISRVEYTITGDNINLVVSKEVGMIRKRSGNEYLSLMEFKHDFYIPNEWTGKTVNLFLAAYDENGVQIDGTTESINIYVAA